MPLLPGENLCNQFSNRSNKSLLVCRRDGVAIHDWSDLLQPRLEGRLAMLDSPRDFLGVAFKTLGLPFNCTFAQLKHSTVSLHQLQARVQQLHKQVTTSIALLCCLSVEEVYTSTVHQIKSGHFTLLAVVMQCLQLAKASWTGACGCDQPGAPPAACYTACASFTVSSEHACRTVCCHCQRTSSLPS